MSKPFVALDFPPWAKWGRRCGIVIFQTRDVPVCENGKPGCGWCGKPCEGRRTSWCSNACSDKHGKVWSWGALSRYIFDRDGGICTRCGTDCAALPPRIIGRWKQPRRQWAADHILPVAHGGTDDPANLRLVCDPCHLAVGAEQRAARKAVA